MLKQIIPLPFDEQLDYFREKLPLPAETLKGIDARYHDRAFSVSRLVLADLVRSLHRLLQTSYDRGEDYVVFKSRLQETETGDRVLTQFSDRHLRIVYDTNLGRAYGAGRYQQQRQPGVLKAFPYSMWVHGDSPQERPHHKALDGKIFPSNHEFWRHAYPPCGFGCRCRVRMVSERALEQMGKRVEAPPDWRKIVDHGFEWSAGVATDEQFAEALEGAIARQPPELQKVIKEQLKNRSD